MKNGLSPTEVRRLTDGLSRRVRLAAAEAVAETAEQLRREAARLTPVRTGRLAAAWRIDGPSPNNRREMDSQAGELVRLVANDLDYASAVEFGTLGRPGAHMAATAAARLAGRLGEALGKKLVKGPS